MRDLRKVLAAVAVGASAVVATPAVSWAAPAHPAATTGFTGEGTSRFFGSLALSAARSDAKAQIAAAGINLLNCFEVSNDVEFNDFSRLWVAESVWQCNV